MEYIDNMTIEERYGVTPEELYEHYVLEGHYSFNNPFVVIEIMGELRSFFSSSEGRPEIRIERIDAVIQTMEAKKEYYKDEPIYMDWYLRIHPKTINEILGID